MRCIVGASGAVVKHCVRTATAAARQVRGVSGQGTVEFAVVTAAILSIVIALGVLWRAFEGGLFVEHAVASASHHVQGALGAVADVFMF